MEESLPVNLIDTPSYYFPNISQLDFTEETLVVYSFDASIDRMVEAYRQGCYLMPIDSYEPLLFWWANAPRLIIIPEEAKFSKSLRQLLRKNCYQVKIDTRFEEVVQNCKNMEREGAWINEKVVETYLNMHEAGYSHSVEVYRDGKMVGGLFGTSIGAMFAGESMFHLESNTSKIAFYYLMQVLPELNIQFVDCQQVSKHFLEWGGRVVSCRDFYARLHDALQMPTQQYKWTRLLA